MFSLLSRSSRHCHLSQRCRPLATAIACSTLVTASLLPAPAQSQTAAEVRRNIVKIVSTGVRINANLAERHVYSGSGFIVHTTEASGTPKTVIVTADHVLGYQQLKVDRGEAFKNEAEFSYLPPIWVNKGDARCDQSLVDKADHDDGPCRRIEVFYRDDSGQWTPYMMPPSVHAIGMKTEDVAILYIQHFHPNLKTLDVGIVKDLYDAARQTSGQMPQVAAWGVEADTNQQANGIALNYHSDVSASLKFQNPVKRGLSGGPILFNGKVVGVISAIESGYTIGAPIHFAVKRMSDVDSPAVQNQLSSTIANARNALAVNEFATAQRMLNEIWKSRKKPDAQIAARLLAKLNAEKFDKFQVALSLTVRPRRARRQQGQARAHAAGKGGGRKAGI